jgi:hypothetical protein
MPIRTAVEPASLVASLIVVAVVLGLHALLATRAWADLRAHGGRVRSSTTETWQWLIVVVGIVGPLAYFAFGRIEP